MKKISANSCNSWLSKYVRKFKKGDCHNDNHPKYIFTFTLAKNYSV
jgi:hypothetical protein